MPIKGIIERRKYHREWVAKRRADFFKDKQCVSCSSIYDLQLDHLDPKTKISHSIWSWSKSRREIEIEKCIVLCKDCHYVKTYENDEYLRGSSLKHSKLTKQQVKDMRSIYEKGGISIRGLATKYEVDSNTIWKIIKRKSWIHI